MLPTSPHSEGGHLVPSMVIETTLVVPIPILTDELSLLSEIFYWGNKSNLAANVAIFLSRSRQSENTQSV